LAIDTGAVIGTGHVAIFATMFPQGMRNAKRLLKRR